jgi:hypothetical protein
LVRPEELAASFNSMVGASVKIIDDKHVKIMNLHPVTIHPPAAIPNVMDSSR